MLFLGKVQAKSDEDTDSLENANICTPLPHVGHLKDLRLTATRPHGDPIVKLKVCISEESYISNGLQPPQSQQIEYNTIADTRAGTTVARTMGDWSSFPWGLKDY